MSKRLTRVRRTFFFYQVTILMSALSVFFFLTASGYIRNAREEAEKKLDKTSRLIIDRVRRGESIPEMIEELYVYFVLDMTDGSYITPRKDANASGGQLWEGFRAKLTYQMQKQKNGQIFYPAREPREIFKSTKILQYATLPDLGRIVVTETLWPSDWELLRNIMRRDDLVNLVISIFAGLIVLKVLTNVYFGRLEGQISDTHEYSFRNFNQNITGSSLPRKRKNAPKSTIQIDQAGGPQHMEPKPKTVFSEKALGANMNNTSDSSRQITTVPAAKPGPHQREDRAQVREKTGLTEKPKPGMASEAHLSQKQREENPTVNIEEIQSPVLKKLLEEMRGHKKRG